MISQQFCRQGVRHWLLQRGRIGRSKAKAFFRVFLNPEQTVEIMPGLRMAVDLRIANQDSIFWFYEETEPALQWAIRHLFPIGGVFFDVGANAGLMGLLAAYLREAQVWFVEPHPRLAETLRRNLSLNDFKPVPQVLEWAASDVDGEATLHVHSPKNDGGHTLKPFSESVGTHQVRTHRLEGFLQETQMASIDLLKIDAEGHDFEVLKGLGDFLTPSRIPMIYVEMEHFDGLSRNIWDLLSTSGYCPFSAVTGFIDQLHHFARLKAAGKPIALFRPTDILVGGNVLWVEQGSSLEHVLTRRYTHAGNLA